MDFTTYYKTGRQLLDYQVSIYDIIDSGFEHYNYLQEKQGDFYEQFYVYRFSHILNGVCDLLAINLLFCDLYVDYLNDYIDLPINIQSHLMESLQMGRDMFRDTEDFISAIYLGFLEHENKYDSNTINLLSQQKQLLKKTNAELRRMERFFEKYDY